MKEAKKAMTSALLQATILMMNNQISGLRLSNEEINRLTKDAIQEALIYLLGKKTMDQISITEIVEKAGVSRAAYYRNYRSKDEILKDFPKNVFDLLFAKLDNDDYLKDPLLWYRTLFTHVRNNSRILTLLERTSQLSVLDIFPPMKEEALTKEEVYRLTAYESAMASLIERWIRQGFDLPSEAMAALCVKTLPNIDFVFEKRIVPIKC